MGEGVNGVDSSGRTGLMGAVWKKHNSIVEFLLQYPGVDVNCQDIWGTTALHYSVPNDNLEGLRLLLAHPGMRSLNTRAGGGWTPLMTAVCRGSLSCVRELVGEEGVDLDTRDGQGRSLQEVARKDQRQDILDILQAARQRQERGRGPALADTLVERQERKVEEAMRGQQETENEERMNNLMTEKILKQILNHEYNH